MGPAPPPKYGADGLVWAWHLLQNIKLIILYGPRTGLKLCYRWSHMGPLLVPHVLLMVLHGPSTGQNQWHCMCPALVPKYIADCLAWAQHCPQNMVLMVLYGPSICFKIYSRSSCMGPELSSKYRADCLAWAQHWSQHLLPRALYGSSIGFKMCHRSSCMGPALAPNSATNGLIWAHPGPICAAS